jgi:N,N'-diacetyllegionaminate synthase
MKNKVIIIAEAGVNHNGNLNYAYQLIDSAKNAGVDFIKFQTFKSENLVSKEAKKADYQSTNTKNESETQFQMLKKLELSVEDHEKIIAYCKYKEINFFSTAFDLESLKYLHHLGLELVKIPSGEITNLPYLRLAAQLFKQVIISTGMSTISEIEDAVKVFTDAGISKESITILHCNTDYPTKMEDVNLNAMIHIQKVFGTKIGYSDHTLGIDVPIAAVALGANCIEKHFTLDRNLPGPDHVASLEPHELINMVRSIRNVEQAISGNGLKTPSKSELKNILVARKSIYLAKDKKQGDIISEDDLVMKRPGDGISPMLMDYIIGKELFHDIKEGSKITWEIIKQR